MKASVLFTIAALTLGSVAGIAQNIPDGSLLGNTSGAPAPATPQTLIPYIPIQHPQGSFAPKAGHLIPFLDENVQWSSDQFSIFSRDPTAGAGNVLVNSASSGDLVKVRISFGATNVDLSHSMTSGDTPATAALAIYNAALANSTLSANHISAQYPGNGGAGSVGITHNYDLTPTITNLSTGSTSVTIAQPTQGLDAAPVFALQRCGGCDTGRTPQAGDNLGQFFAVGPSVNTPNTLSLAYVGQQFTAIDPHDATATGEWDVFTRDHGAWTPQLGVQSGVALWNSAGQPAQFMGVGTMNVPPDGGYYQGGVPLGTPVLTVRLSANQSVSSAQLTKVNLDAVDVDTGNYFNTSTHAYTPQVPGLYMVCIKAAGNATWDAGQNLNFYLEKSGAVIDQLTGVVPAFTGTSSTLSDCRSVRMNGTTDDLTLHAYLVSASGAGNPLVVGNSNGFTMITAWRQSS